VQLKYNGQHENLILLNTEACVHVEHMS